MFAAILSLIRKQDEKLAEAGAYPDSRQARLVAAGLTLILHAALLIAVARMVMIRPDPSGESVSLALILAAPVMPEPSRSEIANETLTIHVPSTVLDMPPPVRLRISHSLPFRISKTQPAIRAARPAPQPFTPLAGVAISPAQRAVPDNGSTLVTLEAAIDQAIRGAAVMPNAARRLRREGRVLVHFSYLDGAAEGAEIIQSAHSILLDKAALWAVQRASYPATPESLRGRRLDFVLWIDFRLVSS